MAHLQQKKIKNKRVSLNVIEFNVVSRTRSIVNIVKYVGTRTCIMHALYCEIIYKGESCYECMNVNLEYYLGNEMINLLRLG